MVAARVLETGLSVEMTDRGHFPTEQAAMKVLYLTAIRQRKNRQDLIGRTAGWKAILNTLTVHYGDRITNHI